MGERFDVQVSRNSEDSRTVNVRAVTRFREKGVSSAAKKQQLELTNHKNGDSSEDNRRTKNPLGAHLGSGVLEKLF
jgi:hypothetical protein